MIDKCAEFFIRLYAARKYNLIQYYSNRVYDKLGKRVWQEVFAQILLRKWGRVHS